MAANKITDTSFLVILFSQYVYYQKTKKKQYIVISKDVSFLDGMEEKVVSIIWWAMRQKSVKLILAVVGRMPLLQNKIVSQSEVYPHRNIQLRMIVKEEQKGT